MANKYTIAAFFEHTKKCSSKITMKQKKEATHFAMISISSMHVSKTSRVLF